MWYLLFKGIGLNLFFSDTIRCISQAVESVILLPVPVRSNCQSLLSISNTYRALLLQVEEHTIDEYK
jgi:hypothetical protein